ncbi:MAG: hypothetical protein IJ228_08685 [Succinivibrio sp.]|nr:hypothetical protein [Succinivibrio sp.]
MSEPALPHPVYTLCQIVFPVRPDFVAVLPEVTRIAEKKFPNLSNRTNPTAGAYASPQSLRWDFNAEDGQSGIILLPGVITFNFMGEVDEHKLSAALETCNYLVQYMKNADQPCTRVGCRRAYLLGPEFPLCACLKKPDNEFRSKLGKAGAYASMLFSFKLRDNAVFKISLSYEDPPQALSFDLRGHSLMASVQPSSGDIRLDIDGSSFSALPLDLDFKTEILRYLSDTDEVLQLLSEEQDK